MSGPNQDVLPADILAAIRRRERLVLITGAGCSCESPTDLPLGAELASDAHDLLVDENILREGDCLNKRDLSEVANAVVRATGSQRQLVNRFPLNKMRAPTPNEGHLNAVALLRERALSSIVTLNFDLALTVALGVLGGKEVSTVMNVHDLESFADPCLIYLHGTANAPADDWVLRQERLDNVSDECWQTHVARRVLTSPVVVFVGLGSPAAVLTESLNRIRSAVGEGVRVFQVDPASPDDSVFAETLQLEDGQYIEMGWCAFMKVLSERLAVLQAEELREKAQELTIREEWEEEDLDILNSSLGELGLIGLGRLRAAWLLDSSPYVPQNAAQTELVADLALALMLVVRCTGTDWRLQPTGVIEVRDGDRIVGQLAFASGRQSHRWSSLEAAVAQYADRWRGCLPTAIIVSGYVGPENPHPSPPPSILEGEENPDSIIAGPHLHNLVSADAVRSAPTRIREILFA